VINETFVGWYREDTGFKIPEVAKREDAKDNLAVLVSAGSSPKEKDCNLIFPKGLPTSVGGMYTCKGEDNEAKLKIVVRCECILATMLCKQYCCAPRFPHPHHCYSMRKQGKKEERENPIPV